ncbi:hypothetical protein SAMN05216417_10953 [Nitrosospira multiformis]|uniref:Uncharacterized protein n=1 Tax=Nitrosospira multiformis TaxID=1231 RepID=A0A1I7HGQ6_9PROT|nr:hypothetical protein SAMN05216417_10953 [Nitrosospira multiformis]
MIDSAVKRDTFTVTVAFLRLIGIRLRDANSQCGIKITTLVVRELWWIGGEFVKVVREL